MTRRRWRGAVLALALAVPAAASAPIRIVAQGVLYTGGERDGDAVVGQTYAFYQIPPKQPRRWPIIFIHGSRQTGAGFLGTPDGRPGWATFFLSHGWPVYVIDQPGKGKAGYSSKAYGALTDVPSREHTIRQFSAPESLKPLPWPAAAKHDQWPGGAGSGVSGQPAFEQLLASQVGNMPDVKQQYALTVRGVSELLHRIGPAIIVTHSQAGPLTWMIAEANPGLVKALIAVEPTGDSSSSGELGAPCALTLDCLRFSPAVAGPADLHLAKAGPDTPERRGCWLQAGAVHRLPELDGIPILIATGEASYHASSDHCTSAFLTQAGVRNDYVFLPTVGIRGNGHMQMLETNTLQIAAFYEAWLLGKLR
jgi:pimeloyl-ACP methyl ester carboxylesterase